MTTAPKSFIKKQFLTFSVIFEVLFSVAFLFLYKPYSDTFWFALDPANVLLKTILFYICAVALTALSKALLRRINKSREISVLFLSLWHLIEFAFVTGIYLAFTYAFGFGPEETHLKLVFRVFLCVGSILYIPYFFCLLIAIIRDNQEEIRLLRLNHPLTPPSKDSKTINLYDRSGVLRISASEDDIFYVESQDNYVNIHYQTDGSLTSYMLRCTTSELEEALAQTHIIRCHRSYLVNSEKIVEFRHSKSRSIILLSDRQGSEIPVSKNYYKTLLGIISPEKIIRRARSNRSTKSTKIV